MLFHCEHDVIPTLRNALLTDMEVGHWANDPVRV